MGVIKHDKTHCAVPQCFINASKNPDISFFRFPRAGSGKYGEEWNRNKIRLQKEWIRILKIGKKISNRSVVCSKHFKDTDFSTSAVKLRRLKPNVVPSLFLPLSSTDKADKQVAKQSYMKKIKDRYLTLSRKRENAAKAKQPDKMVLCHGILGPAEESFENQDQFNDELILKRTRETAEILLQLSEVNPKQFNEEEAANMLSQVCASDPDLQVVSIGIQVNSGDFPQTVMLDVYKLTQRELNSLTGICSLEYFEIISKWLSRALNKGPKRTLSVQHRLLLTMMKMKCNLSFSFLGILFKSSSTTCKTIFTETIIVLYGFFKDFISFLPQDVIVENIPKCFSYFSDVRIVLDCTEIPVGKPACLHCAIATYSQYKSMNTLKYMVGVNPSGLISIISNGYGGRCSDKCIFEQSRIIEMLQPGEDAVMVDRGFLIDGLCLEKNIKLVRPPFLKGVDQLSPADAELTKKIAKARVHVERVIARIKIFQIFKGKVSWQLSSSGLLDKMMVIAAAVTNISSPVLSLDKF